MQIFVTKETKKESYSKVKESLGDRQKIILTYLKPMKHSVTAKELVMHLNSIGITKETDRNFVHPRLNELVSMGYVEITGKKTCQYTGRKVALYKYKSL